MTLEEVKQFLEQHKEDEQVKAYLGELKQPTKEDVEGFLDTEEGKQLLQPRLDNYFTKGLNTWKENNLNKIIEDEVAKRNPKETPEQKRIRELEEQIEQGKQEAQREKLMNKAVSQASEKGLPTDIVSFFIGEDEDSTLNNLATFEEKYNAAVQSKVDEQFKQQGRNVDGGNTDPDSEGAKFAQQLNNQKQTNAPDPWSQGGNE
ncbi:DUF4355 domain-containing protein [Salimicrobium jeotgali]|uniref:DUF4355 domain-containing protein n=1 Tax=Salimicrobium jeotgali TaxID=1230341 RepID=UPI000C854B7D|nr:DUF4355 domain-containing protein [Salimicrobium jeotgali]